MGALGPRARKFCAEYSARKSELASAANRAKELVTLALDDSPIELHAITGRPKSGESALAKIRSKQYGQPARQLTDVVGVRVITYYQNDVDRVAAILAARFEIDRTRSVDRRRALDIAEFGYRSVHLIARQKRLGRHARSSDELGDLWFEIQIRSILEHAWAEVEHGIRYKSGVRFSDEFNRRFGALAGTLELVESQFLAMKSEYVMLVSRYLNSFKQGAEWHCRLDAASLFAALECLRPKQLDLRDSDQLEVQLPRRLGKICVEALAASGIRTPSQLRSTMASEKFGAALSDFASLNRLGANKVSHLAAVSLALTCKSPRILREEYPELTQDPTVNSLIQERHSRHRSARGKRRLRRSHG